MATCSPPRRCSCPAEIDSLFDYAMVSTMKRAAAVGVSPNRITLLRDADATAWPKPATPSSPG